MDKNEHNYIWKRFYLNDDTYMLGNQSNSIQVIFLNSAFSSVTEIHQGHVKPFRGLKGNT